MRVCAAVLLCSATLIAQAEPTFDVASLKRNTSLNDYGGGGPRPGGRYRLTNVPARSMISIAWNIPSNRVLGGPGWVADERYDLDATTKENATQDEMRAMVRTLLHDRFKLAAHVEQRDLPVYLLTKARPDGPLGPSLERSTFDCNDLAARKQNTAAALAARSGRMLCGFTTDTGTLDAGGTTMETLAQILTFQAGRPVIDRTGLTGGYNVLLKWTATLATDAPAADAVSLFAAVQEQLGLKLESATAPLDVVVIDRIERPSEN
jgi:bla regulator protein blaR1